MILFLKPGKETITELEISCNLNIYEKHNILKY